MTLVRSKKLKIHQSILNRRKGGFTAQHIYQDSEAEMSYVLKCIRKQVMEGTLIETKVEESGRKHYKQKPLVRKLKEVEVDIKEPLWVSLVKHRIIQLGSGGGAAVASELGVSPATISGIKTGNYPARKDGIEARVLAKYADEGIECPHLGQIKRGECLDKLSIAQKMGVKGPLHVRRLRDACLKCNGEIHKSGFLVSVKLKSGPNPHLPEAA